MLFHRSRIAFFVLMLIVVLVVGGIVDGVMNFNKIYSGVSVGSLELSGKTREQAAQLIEQEFGPVLQAGSAFLFSDEAAMAAVNAGIDDTSETPAIEQQAVVDAVSQGQLWLVDAASLSAVVDSQAIAESAFQVGRADGGVGTRFKAMFGGVSVEPAAKYDDEAFENLAQTLDSALGTARVDYGVTISDGYASVVEGHDGTMVNRDTLRSNLDAALFAGSRSSFVVAPEYAPLRIGATHAQATADAVNGILSRGVSFSMGTGGWDFTASETSRFVVIHTEQIGDALMLVPYVDTEKAAAYILDRATGLMSASLPTSVTFKTKDDVVSVSTDGSGTIPLAQETAVLFDQLLFAEYRSQLASAKKASEGEESEAPADGTADAADAALEPIVVTVSLDSPPKSLTFDEALSLGVIEAFSTYTTEYTDYDEDANRNHNIQLAATLLNNSIVSANGGTWSFHEVVGHCNEEAGFLGAGIILNEEHVDAVGGGICQVATTVFNSVYEAGLPVVRRHNHTLFVPYYPDGRDAAVSWPDLDFIWENDTPSDVLVTSSFTDTTLTITLYGVNPHREVQTYVGDWVIDEKFATRLKCDESMAKGESKVLQYGDDARNITIYRTVYDRDGNVLHENVFYSRYDSEVEIIVAGPDTEIELDDGRKLVAQVGKTVSSG